VATVDGSAPTRSANSARDSSTLDAQPSQLVRPLRQSDSAACSASQAGRGGNPYEEVFR